jgi:hypothetical protein
VTRAATALAWAVAAPACCLGLTACGGGDGKAPAIEGAPRQAATAVQALERAVSRRDFRAVCADLLTREARRLAGGSDCAALMARSAEGLRRPRIKIRKIEINGDKARVEVLTSAAGERPVRDVLELVRGGGRYRIASLTR